MNTKSILSVVAAAFTAIFTPSCAPIDIPVLMGSGYSHGGGGPVYIENQQGFNPGNGYRPPGSYHNNGRSRYYDQPNGYGRTIYHGSQSRHVYGNGPQSYSRMYPSSGGYNPNIRYGLE